MTAAARSAGRFARPAALAVLAILLAAAGPRAQPLAPSPLPDLEARPQRPAWMGIRGTPGVEVVEVVPGGPAERAGLKKGDVITAVDDLPSLEDGGLMAYLGERSPGETLRLQVSRDGSELALTLVLDEFPMDVWKERQRETPALSPAPVAPPGIPGAPRADLHWLGEEERPFLGLRLQELTPGLAQYFGLPADSPGLLVEHVHEDSPAESAGLRAGDVLLALDGKELRAMPQLGELLRERAVGEPVRLAWIRQGRRSEKSATLAARKKDIWVVSPPGLEGSGAENDLARRELETRLRLLQAQRERVEQEERSIRMSLEALEAREAPE